MRPIEISLHTARFPPTPPLSTASCPLHTPVLPVAASNVAAAAAQREKYARKKAKENRQNQMKCLSYIFIMPRGRYGKGGGGRDSLRASNKLINLSGLWRTMEKPQLRPVSGKKIQTTLAKKQKDTNVAANVSAACVCVRH